jgi:hypothetical protein
VPPDRAVRAVCPGTSIGNPAVYTELPVALPDACAAARHRLC